MTQDLDYTLHLDHLDDLFLAPVPNPYAEHPNYQSGIEQIFNSLERRRPRRQLRTRVVLANPDRGGPSLEEARSAVRRYCDSRIAIEEVNIACHRREGAAKLALGLGFLAVVLVVKATLDRYRFGSELVQQFMAEGLTVLGWVMVWAPLAILLLDWWPARRNADAYRAIRDMALEIAPADPVSPGRTPPSG